MTYLKLVIFYFVMNIGHAVVLKLLPPIVIGAHMDKHPTCPTVWFSIITLLEQLLQVYNRQMIFSISQPIHTPPLSVPVLPPPCPVYMSPCLHPLSLARF